MIALQIIARLIDFPTEDLNDHKDDLLTMIENSDELNREQKHNLSQFVCERAALDFLDWQSEYDALFERGRSLSLFLFEHTHGESRDRGQAMVDLLARYREAGLELSEKELPDYLPVYLEFVSTQGEDNVKAWIEDFAPVLAVLATRLRARESNYALLFETLLSLADISYDRSALNEQIDREVRDDTPEQLDKVWEEEMVTFGSTNNQTACESGTFRPSEAQRRDHQQPLNLASLSVPNA